VLYGLDHDDALGASHCGQRLSQGGRPSPLPPRWRLVAATTVARRCWPLSARASGPATGGIGGVHRGALGGRPTLDRQLGFEELARRRSRGLVRARAIPGRPLTLEYLGIPRRAGLVIGQDEGSYSRARGPA
jgi:hypothetical protein